MQRLSAFMTPSLKKELKNIVKTGLTQGGKAAGGIAGTYLGNGRIGKRVGGTIGAKLSKLVGSGDYASNTEDIAVNSLVKKGVTQYASFGDNTSCVRIQHREYIRDIFSGPTAGAFAYTTVSVNPGLQASFPYLHGIAQNFEEYRVNGIVYELVSSTSPYNANSAMGTTIMAMQYNASNPAFTTKPQMENSDFAISARFDKSVMYGIECKDLSTNNLYIRELDISNRVPLTQTDVGLLQIATQPSSTFPVNSTIGELWVSYDIEFMRPHIVDSTEASVNFSHVSTTPILLLQNLTDANGDFTIYGKSGPFTGLPSPIAPFAFQPPTLIVGLLYQMVITCVRADAAAIAPPTLVVPTGVTIRSEWFNAAITSSMRVITFSVDSVQLTYNFRLSQLASTTLQQETGCYINALGPIATYVQYNPFA